MTKSTGVGRGHGGVRIRARRVDGDVAYIPLSQGYEAVIDVADLGLVSGVNWYAHKTGAGIYARSERVVSGVRVRILLHRAILGLIDSSRDVAVDHIDGDPMNNRRANLRICTHQQNMMNRRPHRRAKNPHLPPGVIAVGKRYIGLLHKNGERFSTEKFDTPDAAHLAYVALKKCLFGEFCRELSALKGEVVAEADAQERLAALERKFEVFVGEIVPSVSVHSTADYDNFVERFYRQNNLR